MTFATTSLQNTRYGASIEASQDTTYKVFWYIGLLDVMIFVCSFIVLRIVGGRDYTKTETLTFSVVSVSVACIKDKCYEGCFSGNSSIIVRGRLSNHSFIAGWS